MVERGVSRHTTGSAPSASSVYAEFLPCPTPLDSCLNHQVAGCLVDRAHIRTRDLFGKERTRVRLARSGLASRPSSEIPPQRPIDPKMIFNTTL